MAATPRWAPRRSGRPSRRSERSNNADGVAAMSARVAPNPLVEEPSTLLKVGRQPAPPIRRTNRRDPLDPGPSAVDDGADGGGVLDRERRPIGDVQVNRGA